MSLFGRDGRNSPILIMAGGQAALAAARASPAITALIVTSDALPVIEAQAKRPGRVEHMPDDEPLEFASPAPSGYKASHRRSTFFAFGMTKRQWRRRWRREDWL